MKQVFCDRLNAALLELYHNATPDLPYSMMEAYDKLVGREGAARDVFQMEAEFEIDYLNGGGVCGLTPYGEMKHNADKSPAHKRLLNRQYQRERAHDKWLPILRHGKLYTYGRGGRTLAPSGLVSSGGNVMQFAPEDMNNAAAVELIQAVEAFNAYVTAWNSRANLVALFEYRLGEARDELLQDIKAQRKATLALIRDAKASKRTAGPVCDLVRDAIVTALQKLTDAKERLATA